MEPRRRARPIDAMRLRCISSLWAPLAGAAATWTCTLVTISNGTSRVRSVVVFAGRCVSDVGKEMYFRWSWCKLISLGCTLSCRLEVADWEQQMAALSLLQPVALASRRGTDLDRSWAAQPQLTIGCVNNGPMPHPAAEAQQRG